VRLAPFATHPETGALTRTERLATGRVVEILVHETQGGVRVEVPDGLTGTERQKVSDKVSWMLELDHDLSRFYALARQEPRLAHVEAKAQGRLLRGPTLFEDVIKTILTTNTTWHGTIRMVETLVTHFGDPLPADPARHAFPTPDQLAASDEETLRTTARLGYRAPYVLALARDVASGDLDLESLPTAGLPTAQLRKQLLAIKGVGSYAAANLLMILGRYDFVPVDSWAIKLVSHEWHGGEPIGQAEVEAAFQPWGAWKGLAYWFWDWSYREEG
jgi:3-methyladenine DNA glycosylase/8-oxoguanine DNA glycosylase